MKKQRKLLKWIALSLCLMPWGLVRATDYLKGSWDSWSGQVEFVYKNDHGIAIKHLSPGTYSFAFVYSETYYKCSSTIKQGSNLGFEFSTGANDCGLEIPEEGDYVFEVKWIDGNPCISVHYPGDNKLEGYFGDDETWSAFPMDYEYGNFSYTLDLAASKTYQFLIHRGDSYYKCSGTMERGNSSGWKFSTDAGSDAHITTTIAGKYSFKVQYWKESGNWYPYVYVVYPTGEEYTIHFNNAASWSDVYAYRFINNTSVNDKVWSGTQLTENELNPGYYDVTFSDYIDRIIFNNNDNSQVTELAVDFDHTETWAEDRNSDGTYTIESTAPSPWYIRALTNVSFSEGSRDWATFVSDIDLDLPADMKAYIVTGVTTTAVTASEVAYIPANTPVLLACNKSGGYSTWSDIKAEARTVVADAVTTGNLLQGSATSATTLPPAGGYVLYKNKLVWCEGTSVAAQRCYLPASVVGSSGARELQIVTEGSEATGIREKLTVDSEKTAAAPVYNLAGQRVGQPTRGLYIVNGKKVVMK